MNREAIAEGDEDDSRPPLDRRVRVRGARSFIGALLVLGYDEEGEEEDGYDEDAGAGEADLGGWFHDLACPEEVEVREIEAGYEYDAYAGVGADEEDSLEEDLWCVCSDL